MADQRGQGRRRPPPTAQEVQSRMRKGNGHLTVSGMEWFCSMTCSMPLQTVGATPMLQATAVKLGAPMSGQQLLKSVPHTSGLARW
uniref:Uncharacterized protein n=1 Tax=Alexandrium catenella TaxID=2925 RepID=A0A7S1W7X5_ALECA